MSTTVLAQGVEGSNPVLNITIFGLFVVITLGIVVYVSRRATSSASDFYTAGGGFSGPQNGVAISGDYLSAASFLGIAGAIALNGYDGFLYSIGFLVAWLVALLLVAELLRNTGKYTMGDVLAFRMRQRPVRAAAATSTLAVSFFYLLAQMAGAGGLVALLLNVTDKFMQGVVIAIVGAVMIAYVLIGGMRGTTWVQIIKAVLLIAGAGIMTIWVLALYGFNFSAVLADAVRAGGETGEALLNPGKQYGKTAITQIDFLSLGLALVLGTAGLPHILMRFYTVPTAKEARRSVVWAIWLIGLFYVFTLVLGYGAGALVGPEEIRAAPGGANSAAPLLAYELGGTVLLGVIAAVAFATILAVVAGLTITASASFAHDIYANVIKKGELTDPNEEVKIARITAVVIGIVAILGGILANGQNIAFLVALAFAVAASANLPTILYSLFWKRFNTQGALWSIYGGLGVTVLLIVFSPVVSGKPVDPATGRSASMLQGVDFSWFPLDNPGIVSIPLSFLLGYLGTVLSKETPNADKVSEMSVRSLTGVGVEKSVVH
ncbi:cation acetate symporter [Pseudonocardia sp. KRD-184]|uniref:Cation acetate symporter n=1 Tax=Pseudonocardia oceani TaxID=2792013 RepID=A0ABS6UGU8_9PSEU|nr:cation acetate symporter [Pseudonocardia oceani]MBW0091605.1 cation acetate symporter [Pseudonocardia oceani]MBW0099595.1 cation acetate symporter [Pseudonocardia oceani]MBW0112232.1 cation acetate symporter [Pseudonocardia oceani]MBW0124314.1 cation acetate symporter [Pseudonocardia oceani]MBW0131432.1 cation acetate symporter [Pseudonocardia oceani]